MMFSVYLVRSESSLTASWGRAECRHFRYTLCVSVRNVCPAWPGESRIDRSWMCCSRTAGIASSLVNSVDYSPGCDTNDYDSYCEIRVPQVAGTGAWQTMQPKNKLVRCTRGLRASRKILALQRTAHSGAGSSSNCSILRQQTLSVSWHRSRFQQPADGH
jgi:hypothetical protein